MANICGSLLSICLLVIISITVEASPTRKHSGFTYLGTFRQPTNESGKEFNDYDYYMSDNSAGWSPANSDCHALENEESQASLVSIETEEEFKFVTELLTNTAGTGNLYYTGGQYVGGNWVWLSGVPIGPWAPWGEGFPTPPNYQSRITLARSPTGIWEWHTQYATIASRYICEMPRSTIAIPCYENNDLIILLDSSGSIGSDNYATALTFAQKLASAWKVNSGNRIGFTIFSTGTPTRIFALTDSLTSTQVEGAILNATYLQGGTDTHLGINDAVAEQDVNNRGVTQNIVVLTDGASNNPTETITAANNAKAKGIRTFSVGITQSVNDQELLTIAGDNADHVFTTESFDELIQLLTPLSIRVCQN